MPNKAAPRTVFVASDEVTVKTLVHPHSKHLTTKLCLSSPEATYFEADKGNGTVVPRDYSGTIVDEATVRGDEENDPVTSDPVGASAVTGNVLDKTKEWVSPTMKINGEDGAVYVTEMPAPVQP